VNSHVTVAFLRESLVLVPILFFCLPTHQIVSAHNVAVQQYADDTQLFDAFSNATLPNARVRFEHCTADLDAWFRFNGLCLSISKFKAILLGTLQRLLSFPTIPIAHCLLSSNSH